MHAHTLPIKIILFLILLVSLTQNASGKSAGENPTHSPADSLYNLLNQWEEQDSLLPWMIALKSRSQTFRDAGDISKAIDILSECLDGAWREPVSTDEQIQKGWAFVNRAYLYDQKYGDFLAAKNDYLGGLKYFELAGYNNYYVARFLLQPLGNIYTRLGENQQAIGMLKDFQEICRQDEQLEALMNSYNDLGRAYMNKEEYLQAITFFDEGAEVDPSDFYNLGLIESSKAEALLYLERYEEGINTGLLAQKHLEKATQEMNPQDFRFEAGGRYLTGVHTILGRLYLKTKRFDESLKQFELAREKTTEFYQGKHRRKSKIRIGIGDCYVQMRAYGNALQQYQLALTNSLVGFDNLDINVNPADSLLFADVVLSEAFIGKARAAYALFKTSGDLVWLNLAVNTYQAYFNWVNKLRAEHLDMRSKLDFLGEIHTIAEEALQAIFDLQTVTGDTELAKMAFQIAEQTKGILLSESDVANALSMEGSDIQEDLQERSRLKMQKSLFQINLNKPDSLLTETEKKRIQDRMGEIDRKIQINDFILRNDYPAYNQLMTAGKDSLNFDELQEYLNDQDIDLLSYFLGDETLFLMACTDGSFQFIQLDFDAYKMAISPFLDQLYWVGDSKPGRYQKWAFSLYELLLGDISSTLGERWLILPDGEMNLIPVEALVENLTSDNASFKTMPYVLLNHTVFYAPSVKFLLQEKRNAHPTKTFFGIAPVFEKSEVFIPLPVSAEEVGYGKTFFEGEVLLKEQATKAAFLQKSEDYELIHLSTHAGLGTGKNNDGWIAFLTEGGHEKMLTPELLQMKLNARLVVLNGCETGAGEIYKGEGILSMARGFIQAGAHSTITNLWQVNHASNAKIMKAFYQTLKDDQSPASALRWAKISYINDQDVDASGAHPFYWAASVLIGTNHKVSLGASSGSWGQLLLWGVGVLLVLFSGIFLLRKVVLRN